jgi:hypothetical protein
MDIDELHSRQGFILDFKGTPSQEVHKTGFSVLTIFELALSGQIGIVWQIVSAKDLFKM